MTLRDYRAALGHDRCRDRRTQEIYERHGEPLDDCILQNREELIALKRTILRPHLELGLDHTTMGIGIWSAQKSNPS